MDNYKFRSKNFKTKFGNLGQNTASHIIDSLRFGTKQTKKTLWSFQHTDLSRKRIKYQKERLQKQSD